MRGLVFESTSNTIKIDVETIFSGFDVRRLKLTIRKKTLARWSEGGPPPKFKLGLWEEGREVGKPTTHAVYSDDCCMCNVIGTH